MSAHDDAQTDGATQDGGLRRLPDPPSLVRSRSASRGADGPPRDDRSAPRNGSPDGGRDDTPADGIADDTATRRLSDFEPGIVAARTPGAGAGSAAGTSCSAPAEPEPDPAAAGTPRSTSAPEGGTEPAGETPAPQPGPEAQPMPEAPPHQGPQPGPPPAAPPRPAHTPAAAPGPQPPRSAPLPPAAPPPATHPTEHGQHTRTAPPGIPYRAVPPRVSVPVVGPELAGTERKVRHGDTFARRTGRYLKRLLASSADSAAVMAAVRSMQQPLAAGRQIAVTSIRGGSGKSTVAALLALGLAHHRTDPVLAVEADPALGTLPRRLSATEVRWSCADLARILDPSMQITDLIGYLLPFPGGGWLLPGSQGTVGAQLDLDTYRVVMTAVRHHFAATVVDCQTLPAEVARTALTTTQARVLVSPATVEGVAATRTVLEWLGNLHRGMLPTTVVALAHTSPDSTLDVRRSAELLGQGGAHVVALPYDRHLAGGGAVRHDLLSLETQEAAALLGGAVMDRAASR
ncbi:hypothetical protein [Streptomyces sp. TR06-5]|uniref:hypothetical protein n=1 Tax=Streptomyces sp. TR06-5 TaxID=3385976 RepID=UPI0039A3674A